MNDNPITSQIPLFIIAGPTASGKTSVAVDVAKQLDAELVGADSMQVYNHMDIGTATPTIDELDGVPHHLINVANPDEDYDAARFAKEADAVITDIHNRGKRVIVVGGTGLYLKVLVKGLQGAPAPDSQMRAQLMREAESIGWPAMHEKLETMDPEIAVRLHPNDKVRIVRAIEVFLQTGLPLSTWQKNHGFAKPRYPSQTVAILWERQTLCDRIHLRVDQMMEMGFLQEVQHLLELGFSPTLKSLQGLGYKRLCSFLDGQIGLETAIENTKTDTRRLSKRQSTWFRGDKDLRWIPCTETHTIGQMADTFFEKHFSSQS